MKLESNLRDHAGFLYTAPLLDVVLLLLVFFLLSTNFVLHSGVSVEVPTSSSILPTLERSHVITVMEGSAARIFLNEEEVSLYDLDGRLQSSDPDIEQVIIRADELAAFGLVMKISELSKNLGYRVAFATTGQ